MADAPPTCIQPMQRGGPMVKGITGCSLVKGGKWPIFDIQSRPLFGGAMLGRHICPKQVADGWDNLMHVREICRERPKTLPIEKREKDLFHNQMDKIFSWDGQWKREKMLGIPRCSGGLTANRTVGIYEEVFTTDKNDW